MKSTVIIQFEAEGFHSYPGAPEQVNFLAYPHRHTFVIKCGYQVTDMNREKEIFICRDQVRDYLYEAYGNPCQFGPMSCEMIAAELVEFGQKEGMVWVEVWEETTGGARVEA